MAKRGAKPKPAYLRLVEGTRNPTRHGSEAELRRKAETAITSFGKLKMPKGLKARARQAWKQYIAPATWLDGSREPAAIAFCELWAEFTTRPETFLASKHSQMRAYMSDIGLTDERNRPQQDEPEKDEFFGD